MQCPGEKNDRTMNKHQEPGTVSQKVLHEQHDQKRKECVADLKHPQT